MMHPTAICRLRLLLSWKCRANSTLYSGTSYSFLFLFSIAACLKAPALSLLPLLLLTGVLITAIRIDLSVSLLVFGCVPNDDAVIWRRMIRAVLRGRCGTCGVGLYRSSGSVGRAKNHFDHSIGRFQCSLDWSQRYRKQKNSQPG